MKKIFFFVAAMCCCVTMMFAVPAPTNVHWEDSILKWELPDLTGDSVYAGATVNLYTATDSVLIYNSNGDFANEYEFTGQLFKGRTYYASVMTFANPDYVGSQEVFSSAYTVPGARDTLEIRNVTLDIDGGVRWESFGYMHVRATLQKKNGNEWEDIVSETTYNGWNTYVSVGAITEPGTYRAIAEGLQGSDVVRRGISEELMVDEMFAVSFDAQSLFDNPDNTIVAKNAKAAAPTVPDEYMNHEDGYIFYWSTDKEGTHPWKFDVDTITQDTTIYAQWKEVTINPYWDVDTCRWSMEEHYRNVFRYATVRIYSEKKKYIFDSSTSGDIDHFFADIYFPGRNYIFSIKFEDYFGNTIVDTSAMHTVAGQAEVLPLELTVTNPSNATVTWTAPKYGVFMRAGVVFHWIPSAGVWIDVATAQDVGDYPKWDNYLTLHYFMEETQYYGITCKLYQGEYLISEGLVYYGTNPFLAVDNIQSDDVQCTKVIRDGQFFIEKNGKRYNAQGVAVK
ncbi:MAG: InlB B-repeat-containing protein [Paludibacteraceae bacterium]|nr:InlB B-repeat-containing protein [Paludibacteraceae bacterium]